MPARALDVDLLARELGNWRTSSRSGPAYHGLADAIRLLIIDGRLPVGARLPSERVMADTLRVSRTTVTAAYAALRDDGYLKARRGARSTTALPVSPTVTADATTPSMSLSAAALPLGPRARQLADVQSAAARPTTVWPTPIRLLIVDGRLPVGARLPSERAMADTLRVSRTTVTAAYAALREDGYLNARRGARSTTALPVAPAVTADATPPWVNLAAAALSAPAAAVAEAFADATRDVTPYLHQVGQSLSASATSDGRSPKAIVSEAFPLSPDQIMVTTGALQAISLTLTTYVQPGDRVLVEQPTFHGALSSITTAGARPFPVAVTADGWELDRYEPRSDNCPRGWPTCAGQSQPDRVDDARNETESSWRASSPRRAPARHRRDHADMWLDEPMPAPMAASMTARSRPDADGRLDVEVVLGRPAGRVDSRRARHLATIAALRPSIDMGTAVFEQFAAARLLAQRDELLPERRETLRDAATLLLSLLSAYLPDWEPLPARRDVAVGSATRTDEHGTVGGRLADRTRTARLVRDSASTARSNASSGCPITLPEDQLTEAVELLARAWHTVTGSTAASPPSSSNPYPGRDTGIGQATHGLPAFERLLAAQT